MSEIVIKPIDSKFYQPNIVIAIFLCLYKSTEITFKKKQLGDSLIEFNNFIDKLVGSVIIDKFPDSYEYHKTKQ